MSMGMAKTMRAARERMISMTRFPKRYSGDGEYRRTRRIGR